MHEKFTRAEAGGVSLKSQTSIADTFQATHCLCYILFAVYATFLRLFLTQVDLCSAVITLSYFRMIHTVS